jgi:hypothetical protein
VQLLIVLYFCSNVAANICLVDGFPSVRALFGHKIFEDVVVEDTISAELDRLDILVDWLHLEALDRLETEAVLVRLHLRLTQIDDREAGLAHSEQEFVVHIKLQLSDFLHRVHVKPFALE